MLTIRPVLQTEIPQLSALATRIVRAHFDPIIGKAQNDYMLEKFQTVSAIEGQFANGYRYYWAVLDGSFAGFFAIFPKNGKMYLSKFYVAAEYRGLHIATVMMERIVALTKADNLPAVYLNVNRNNWDVIRIYEHFGFRIVREEQNDIGCGFIMDDFVLEKEL